MTSFRSLPLDPALLRALDVLAFQDMTPVQESALPAVLEGKDVIAQARTGSGKTAAFGLGLLSALDVSEARTQALVLCPTRELADQVGAEIRRLGRFFPNLRVVLLCGGVPARAQLGSLEHPPHVVVGTPGRVLDHLQRRSLRLGDVKVLVLDEADRMLDMGFLGSIKDVVKQTSRKRQTLLFSASYPDEIRKLSKSLQREPVEVTVDEVHAAEEIEQTFYEVSAEEKLHALVALLYEHKSESALVFCHTRVDTRDVATQLARRGFSALALHGDLEQGERDQVLLRFANKSCTVLVATDVAARGLDIEGLPVVIEWELPTDPLVHVHRVGRTGRAGKKGVALSLCTEKQRPRAEAIAAQEGKTLRWGKLNLAHAASMKPPAPAPMVTVVIEGGKRDKLRPGDILGALTGDVGLVADDVGKIDILPNRAYVAVRRERAERALAGLREGKIKNRSFRVRSLA